MALTKIITKTGTIQKMQNNAYLNVSFFPYGSKLYCKKMSSFLYVKTSECDEYDLIANVALNTAKIANTKNSCIIETSVNMTNIMKLMGWSHGNFIQVNQISEDEYTFSQATDYSIINSTSGKIMKYRNADIGTIFSKDTKESTNYVIKFPKPKKEELYTLIDIQTEKEDFITLTYRFVSKIEAMNYPSFSNSFHGKSVNEKNIFRIGTYNLLPKHLVRFFSLSKDQVLPVISQDDDHITFGISTQKEYITGALEDCATEKMKKISLSNMSSKSLKVLRERCEKYPEKQIEEILTDMKIELNNELDELQKKLDKCKKSLED